MCSVCRCLPYTHQTHRSTVNSETHKGRENCGYFYMNGQIQYYKRSRSSVCGTSALREIWGETFGTVSITLNWQNHEKTSQNTHKSPNCFKPISQAESKDVSTRPFRARHQPAMQPTSLLPPCFFPASFLLPASVLPCRTPVGIHWPLCL